MGAYLANFETLEEAMLMKQKLKRMNSGNFNFQHCNKEIIFIRSTISVRGVLPFYSAW
jgi:hypothetical protein